MGKQWKQWQILLSWVQNHCRWWCDHEIKRHLLLGRKAMTNLYSILKTRDIILPTKVHTVKGIVSPVFMYGCECWTIKKAECRRTDAFKLWCWRRFFRIPWTARRSNQSILKEINSGYILEGLMMLKLQYFGHLMWRANSLEKTLMMGKIDGKRRGRQQRMRQLDTIFTQWTWVWANSRRQWREAEGATVHGVAKSQTEPSNWTTTN